MKRKKSYYSALMVCLGIAVVGGAISLFGMRGGKNEQLSVEPSIEQQGAQEVLFNRTPETSFLKPMDTPSADPSEDPEKKAEITTKPQEIPKESPTPAVENNQTSQASLSFVMPLDGKIVMDFSMDHAIYDATLEQYRTNESISIAGELGTGVGAAEDGVVADVFVDDEKGKTIVLEHGSGWRTTYSQLDEQVDVNKGDKVKKGQEIGLVGEPTKYGIALGSHLDFAMEKDGQYVDPKEEVKAE